METKYLNKSEKCLKCKASFKSEVNLTKHMKKKT